MALISHPLVDCLQELMSTLLFFLFILIAHVALISLLDIVKELWIVLDLIHYLLLGVFRLNLNTKGLLLSLEGAETVDTMPWLYSLVRI